MSSFLPFPYFGGKFSKINSIINLFPIHKTYIEPYCGSAAVFFNKKPSKKEIISDYNQRIFVFFKMLRDHPHELEDLIRLTPYNQNELLFIEKQFRQPFNYEGKSTKELLEVARQVFTGYNMSFSGLNPSKGVGLKFSTHIIETRVVGFKKDILQLLAKRLSKATILSKKAEYVINVYKNEKDAFFYLDPPYPETHDNYETEYTRKDFEDLVRLLKTIKGKFLLNCYFKDWMRFPEEWRLFEKKFSLLCDSGKGKTHRKSRKECFITNFDVN